MKYDIAKAIVEAAEDLGIVMQLDPDHSHSRMHGAVARADYSDPGMYGAAVRANRVADIIAAAWEAGIRRGRAVEDEPDDSLADVHVARRGTTGGFLVY